MANSNFPFGLRPVRMTNGSPWAGEANLYAVASAGTDIWSIGDVVMLEGTSTVDGIPQVLKYVAGGVGATAPLGPIVGILPVGARPGSLEGTALALENIGYLQPSTIVRFVLVADSTDIIFEAQSDSTGLRRNSVGSNVDIVATAAAAANRLSREVLDGGTDAATATLPYRIIGFSSKPRNEINATAATDEPFVVALVRPNEHAFKVGVVGLAV